MRLTGIHDRTHAWNSHHNGFSCILDACWADRVSSRSTEGLGLGSEALKYRYKDIVAHVGSCFDLHTLTLAARMFLLDVNFHPISHVD